MPRRPSPRRRRPSRSRCSLRGPYVSHCRALGDLIDTGGDDDHHNVYLFEVDPGIADGTPAPDLFLHLWDGDNNATATITGTQDLDIGGTAALAIFEYRLYGGRGAANPNEAPPGSDPAAWTGTLIDIDPDAGVPITSDQSVDVQSLDLDRGGSKSQLTTAAALFGDALTYE